MTDQVSKEVSEEVSSETKYVSVVKNGTDIKVSVGPNTSTDEILGLFMVGLVHSIASQFVSVGEKEIIGMLSNLKEKTPSSGLAADLQKLVEQYKQ